jgi:hypothetical protein
VEQAEGKQQVLVFWTPSFTPEGHARAGNTLVFSAKEYFEKQTK